MRTKENPFINSISLKEGEAVFIEKAQKNYTVWSCCCCYGFDEKVKPTHTNAK